MQKYTWESKRRIKKMSGWTFFPTRLGDSPVVHQNKGKNKEKLPSSSDDGSFSQVNSQVLPNKICRRKPAQVNAPPIMVFTDITRTNIQKLGKSASHRSRIMPRPAISSAATSARQMALARTSRPLRLFRIHFIFRFIYASINKNNYIIPFFEPKIKYYT